MKKPVLWTFSSILLLSACATPQQGASPDQNAAGGAAVGAVAGCAMAAMMGRHCVEGAAAGALIGAVAGWSGYSEKVSSAQSSRR